MNSGDFSIITDSLHHRAIKLVDFADGSYKEGGRCALSDLLNMELFANLGFSYWSRQLKSLAS